MRLQWSRLICANGQYVRGQDTLGKIHNKNYMNKDGVEDFILTRKNQAYSYRSEIETLAAVKISTGYVKRLVDNAIKGKRGVKNAARVFSVATKGYDGEVRLEK